MPSRRQPSRPGARRSDSAAAAISGPGSWPSLPNECRQRRRNRWWSVSKLAELPAIESPGPEANEDLTELRSGLRRLPEAMRLALVLRYYLDLSFDEVGRVLKCSPQAAKSRTHRALAKLRVEVPKEFDT